MEVNREKIVEKINAVFIEQFEIAASDLLPEKQIFTDLGLDSLDVVDLMVGLQRKFGISLRQNEEMRKIRTLQDIYTFFEKLAAEAPELSSKFLQ